MLRSLRPTADLAHGEDGSISVLTAFSMALLLLSLAFAVDVGSVVLAQRDLQGVVDIAALDAAGALGPMADGDRQVRAAQLAEISAATNGDWSDKDDTLGLVTQIGTWDDDTNTFTVTSVNPTAVRVAATSVLSRPFGFIPGVDNAADEAIAELTQAFEISIGTSTAALDSSRSAMLSTAMSGLFGGPVTLDAAGWQGLADATIPLDVLMAELNVGSVGELMNLELTAPELLRASASGLRATGEGLTAAAHLDAIATAVNTVNATTAGLPNTGVAGVDARLDRVVLPMPPVPMDVERTVERDRKLNLRNILVVEEGLPGQVLGVNLNVKDLVTATAMLVNGNNVVDLGIDLSNITGISSGNVSMTVIEPPVRAYGRPGRKANGEWRTVASTGQLRFGVDVLTDSLGAYAGVTVGHLALPIGIEAGKGTAALASVTCNPNLSMTTGTNQVETTAASYFYGATTPSVLGDATVPLPDNAKGRLAVLNVRLDQLGLPGIGLPSVPVELAVISASDGATVAGTSQSLTIAGPFPAGAAVTGSPIVPGSTGLVSTFGGLKLEGTVDGAVATITPQPIKHPVTGVTLYTVDVSSAGVLTIRDPLTGAPLHTINVRDDVLAPAFASVNTAMAEVDATVFAPLLDVLGAATIGNAETHVLDHDCSTRRLVK